VNDRPRGLGRFAWLLPLAVLAIALASMPSDGRGPKKVPFNEALRLVEQGAIKRAELQTRDNVLKLSAAGDTRYETGYLPDNGSELIGKLPRRTMGPREHDADREGVRGSDPCLADGAAGIEHRAGLRGPNPG
jgi:hypothetical protein